MNKRLLIITDTFHPQVNGVVRTIDTTINHIRQLDNWEVFITHTDEYPNIALPWYKEISVTYKPTKLLINKIESINPDFIHIAVEGPLGISARRYCLEKGYNFTTAYHTKFPEYVEEYMYVPAPITYRYMRWFHAPSSKVMVATSSLQRDLVQQGFNNTFGKWSRGVDVNLFHPNQQSPICGKYALYVGRVSHEKNIEDFLKLDIDLQKVVVGDGPQLPILRKKYPEVQYVGIKKGNELAAYYAGASVFVFPSRTDTFGLVMLEALASGTPVAAYNVPSPCDIITSDIGGLADNLAESVEVALTKNRASCRQHVIDNYTWEHATNQFLSNLVSVR